MTDDQGGTAAMEAAPRNTAAMEAAPRNTAAMEAAPRNTAAMEAALLEAVSSVCDPEYPDITIAELGILESVTVPDGGSAIRIELVPTMLGCPALDVIASDVTAAARSACMGSDVSVEVVFVADPAWTPDRISPAAVEFMAREYSVAVRRARSDAACPICGNAALEHRSDFGPTPCRSVEWCPSCRNPIEVVGRVDVPVAIGATSVRPAATEAVPVSRVLA